MSLGLPYMGSKRKLAKPIIDLIIANNPNARYFYDLFGGGGAISFEALQRPQFDRVIYNELNSGVVELLRKIMADGVTDDFYRWVDRDTFNAHKKGDDWFGGLCKVVWSFGNNQRAYLYGKHLENIKLLGHKVIVEQCEKSAKELSEKIGFTVELSVKHSVNCRRIEFSGLMRKNKNRNDLQHLERLQHLVQLQQLGQLEQLGRLELSNKSVFDVVVESPPEQTVIYLDPPYIGTSKYQNDINHDELYDWVAQQNCKVYLSSYESPMHLVKEFEHRSALGAKTNKKVIERLYCSQPERDLSQLF